MTTRAKYQGIASKLFIKFSDLVRPAVFTKPGTGGTLDPIAGIVTGGTQPITDNAGAIREDYEAREIDGQKIQVNDFKLLVQVQELTLDPRTDSVTVTFDGMTCNIIKGNKDAADAVWTLQVRQV